ncbi:hypothetical protein BDFB_004606 [Asbolus verrucosus]|uniref:Uncharacterized protein n=1 Tax=Asbolus verrucosus TaxID=1661398 RepID=A0A482VNZ0_ASBVE|nr:hypothetical protein BDFB_004606 [Asbolus verrucosus]
MIQLYGLADSRTSNPVIFFLCGYKKQLVYAAPAENFKQLRIHIEDAAATIRNNRSMLERRN